MATNGQRLLLMITSLCSLHYTAWLSRIAPLLKSTHSSTVSTTEMSPFVFIQLHRLLSTKAETRLGLTKKSGSTTAYQAYLPINLQKRWMYWNLPYPFGIADIRVEDFIDLDECGLFVDTADKSICKAFVGNRVRQEGNYQKPRSGHSYLRLLDERRQRDGK